MLDGDTVRVIRRTIESLRGYADDLERGLKAVETDGREEDVWRLITALMAIPRLYRPDVITKMVFQVSDQKGESR